MSDLSQNIEAHYTSNPKVVRHPQTAVIAPQSLPVSHVYNDAEAEKKITKIKGDIYEKTQKNKSSEDKKFWKVYLSFVACVLAFWGLKRFFK